MWLKTDFYQVQLDFPNILIKQKDQKKTLCSNPDKFSETLKNIIESLKLDKETLLKWASRNGHLEVVKYLISSGADIHADDECALRWASRNGHLEVVKYLESLS